MPWKESSVMEERLRFVGRLLDGGQARLQIVDRLDESGAASRLDKIPLLNLIIQEAPRPCWMGQ
jgi:hypothetical protein